MQQSVLQVGNDKILHRGVQGDGKSMSGDGLDGVQCVLGQMKGSVLKGSDKDQGGVQGVQCHVLNNVMQISDNDHIRGEVVIFHHVIMLWNFLDANFLHKF